jgi:CheY-like chemotaxis protein
MHGGTVLAHSAGTNQGSEFVVRLPLASGMPNMQLSAPAEVGAPADLSRRRVLIADDNLDAALSLSTLLQMAGHITEIAANGLEAVSLTASFKPDIAILDIGMPELNGYDAARRIREHASGKNLVLIALTGWGQDEDRQRSREAGFDGHLAKPASYAAIAKLIAESQTSA